MAKKGQKYRTFTRQQKIKAVKFENATYEYDGIEKELNVGDRVKLIPGHCCSTINLFDKIYVVDGDKVVDRIIITGKGIGR